jgi:Domain of unknown function (DUF4281)
MPLEQIYSLCSLVALGGWLCLAAAPVGRGRLILAARIFAALLCLAYFTQMFTITEPTGGNFSTLAGVTQLFSSPGNVMLGWTHYLAFDLFVGSWEIEDAGREGIAHWAMIPFLILTFLLGPIGLLGYLIVRSIHRTRNGGAVFAA